MKYGKTIQIIKLGSIIMFQEASPRKPSINIVSLLEEVAW